MCIRDRHLAEAVRRAQVETQAVYGNKQLYVCLLYTSRCV